MFLFHLRTDNLPPLMVSAYQIRSGHSDIVHDDLVLAFPR
jgi:hypothetical protein